MAITRAQQAKQMLQDGGMLVQPGFGGKRQGYRGDDAYGGGRDPSGPGPSGTGGGGPTGPQELGMTTRGPTAPDRTAVGPDSQFAKNRAKQNIDKMLTGLRQTITPSTQPGNRALRTILNITNPGLGEVFASTIDKAQPDIFGTKTDDDDDNNKDRGEGGIFVPVVQQRPMMSESETTAPVTSAPAVDLNRVAYRLMADGGAVIDDEPRQAYGLGSIVKKATRAVKKVAKSDIGKAAILGAIAFGIPGMGASGGLGGGIFGRASFGGYAPGVFGFGGIGNALALGKTKFLGGKLSPNLVDEVALTGKQNLFQRLAGGMTTGKAIAGIGALSALPLLGVGVEDEEEQPVTSPYLTEGLDIAAIRANPRRFQGQAYRLMAEGGDTEDAKEPVAKKVMPLIDMDGKEKDYRETGGFVDMGRMEKADDVPARLSKNEFVFTADAVRNAGDGSVDKGAEVMYNMMKNLEAGGEVSEESQGLKGARKMFQTSQRLEEVL